MCQQAADMRQQAADTGTGTDGGGRSAKKQM
jgi:hypothetical protein